MHLLKAQPCESVMPKTQRSGKTQQSGKTMRSWWRSFAQSKLSLAAVAISCALGLSACSTAVPSDPNNICSIFQEKDSWYSAAHKVQDKYGVANHAAMGLM